MRNNDTTAAPTTSEPKKLSKKEKENQRKQEAYFAALSRQAAATQQMLNNKFFDFFLGHSDPDGTDVIQKMKEVSAQWKVFCKRTNLDKEHFDQVEKYCAFILEDYRNERDGKPQIPKSDEQQTGNNQAMDQAGSGEFDQPETAVRGDEVVRGGESSAGVGTEDPAK